MRKKKVTLDVSKLIEVRSQSDVDLGWFEEAFAKFLEFVEWDGVLPYTIV